jgi:hypothetical protein
VHGYVSCRREAGELKDAKDELAGIKADLEPEVVELEVRGTAIP